MTMNGLDSKQYKYIVTSSKRLYHEKWVSKHKYHWLDSFISTHNLPNLFLNAWNCKLKFITPEISSKKNCNPQQNKTMVFCMHPLEIYYIRLGGTIWWRQKLTSWTITEQRVAFILCIAKAQFSIQSINVVKETEFISKKIDNGDVSLFIKIQSISFWLTLNFGQRISWQETDSSSISYQETWLQ